MGFLKKVFTFYAQLVDVGTGFGHVPAVPLYPLLLTGGWLLDSNNCLVYSQLLCCQDVL